MSRATVRARCPWCSRLIMSTGTAYFEAVSKPTFIRSQGGEMVPRTVYVRHDCPEAHRAEDDETDNACDD